MFDLDKWQEIFYTIRKNKLRTMLTAFSVSWGIFMLILLLGAGNGLQNGVKHQFDDDAINSIWLRSGQTSMPYKGMKPGRQIEFTNGDYEAIRASIEGVEHITGRYYLWGDLTVRYGKKYSSFQVRSVHPGHLHLEKTMMNNGRYLNELDLKERRKVAIIGQKVKEALFPAPDQDPIGEYIDINGIKYKVVGVYNDSGAEGEERIIYIPVSTAQMAYNGRNRLHQIMFTVGNATLEESKAIEAATRKLIAERHTFDPKDERAVGINNGVENFQRFQQVFTAIEGFIWVVGLMTIVAGIVGVSNIMLIVVKDRTREIGIRKALGATPGSIVGLILQESVAITLMAGYIGLLVGIGLIELVSMAIYGADIPFFRNPTVDLNTAIIATVMLVIAGAIAGFIPARKASKVQPIVALRDE